MHPILNYRAPELYIALAMFLAAMWLLRYRSNVALSVLRQALRIGSLLVILEMLWRTGHFDKIINR
jgi:hypothetical protein